MDEDDFSFVGTPRHVVEQMRASIDLGVDYFMVDCGGFPNLTTLELLASEIEHERLVSVHGDVRHIKALVASSAGCDVGIHLAVLAGDSEAIELLSVNVLGAYAFLKASSEAGFRNCVLAGSAPAHLPPSDFDLGLINGSKDADLYDLSKNLQEVIAHDFGLHGLPIQCLRFGHVVFGERKLNLVTPIP